MPKTVLDKYEIGILDGQVQRRKSEIKQESDQIQKIIKKDLKIRLIKSLKENIDSMKK